MKDWVFWALKLAAVFGLRMATGAATVRAQATEAGAVAVALAEVREHGWTPRIVRTSGSVAYPFGYAEPQLTCAPLHACYVALETGERVTGIARGDAVRWKLDTLEQGGDMPRTLIVVKSTACNVGTNLLIATDRRVYDVGLQSPPCEGRVGTVSPPGIRHVSFYFPEEAAGARRDTTRVGVASPASPQPAAVSVTVAPPAPPERLNFGYQWHAAKSVPWAPEQVYDDSAHVYIRLPDAARFAAAPALWEIQPDGTRSLLNYTLQNGTYKTDRLFERAVLSLGVGRNERTVEVTSAHWRPDR